MKNIESAKLLIFDLDGTIADTIEAIREAMNLTMTHFGWPERSYDDIRLAIGNGAKLLVSRSMPTEKATDDGLVAEAFHYYDAKYGETYMHTDCCYPGMKETMVELKKRGYTIAVLSNKQDLYTKKLISQLLGDLASFVQGQTDMPKKPDPTVPLMIASTLGFEPEQTVMIGDSDVDIKTGINAHMQTIGCAWGFRGAECLLQSGADYLLQKPADFLDILKGVISC